MCQYKAALTGALTPVNAFLRRCAFKLKSPFTPATYLVFVSGNAGCIFPSLRGFSSATAERYFLGDVVREAGIARGRI